MITYDNISNIGELTNVAEYDDDDVGDILLMSGLPLEKKSWGEFFQLKYSSLPNLRLFLILATIFT